MRALHPWAHRSLGVRPFEIGIYTFGDTFPDPATGHVVSQKQKLQDTIRLAQLADEVGLDVFAVGEHHRADMAISSPAVVLAAAAQATRRIRLSSATTLLNTLDPVRVHEDFATLDLLSEGRAEIIAGRGSFIESFSLFGYDMKDYDALFAEKLDLFLALRRGGNVTWSGRFRAPLRDAEVSPRPERPLPLWVGVGGTPQSAVRAGQLGLPMNIAILGGPERFVGLAALHRQAAAQASHAPPALAISSLGHLADDAARAKDEFYAAWGGLLRKGMKNRFPPSEFPREAFDAESGPRGAFFAGDAREAIEKIRWERTLFGHQRLLLQLDVGGLPFEKVKRAVEILGTEVAPAVRDTRG